MAPSRSATNFNGNDDEEPLHGASGGSMSTSATHDDHLHFGTDEKKRFGKEIKKKKEIISDLLFY